MKGKPEESKQIWLRKDLMLEIDKNGFCLWKMFKIGKKMEKSHWVIDGSMIVDTGKFAVGSNIKISTREVEFNV
jgi:hypothetical protein